MDRKELRKRWIMGKIQPELFYIPWREKSNEIHIDVMTENGEYCTDGEIQIGFTGWADWYPAENGSYGHYDNYGSRIFEKNGRYLNPIPKENATIQPDLRKVDFAVKGAEIKENGIYSSYFYLILKGKRITISGLPVGSYYLSINRNTAPMWCTTDFRLYPNYYEGMNDSIENHFQINKDKKITGLNVNTCYGYSYNESSYDYDENYPNGYYDVKYVDPPLKESILPVILNEYKYKVCVKILLQCTGENIFYTPDTESRYSINPHFSLGGAYCEVYNKNELIDAGVAASVINNKKISHTEMKCKKYTNIVKCTFPPIFVKNIFFSETEKVIRFRQNTEEKTVVITEDDYYNYRNNNQELSYKEVKFKFASPSVKLELCWMPLPDAVEHITKFQGEYVDSGNKGLAIKMYVEGEYKGYFMCGFHICGVPLTKHFQGVMKSEYQGGKLRCRNYRNRYLFNKDDAEPSNGLFEIIRMYNYPDAPRVLSPLAELCKTTGDSLNNFNVTAIKGLYNNEHGANFVVLNWNGGSFTLLSLGDNTTSYQHPYDYGCQFAATEFDNILKCKCLNETGGLDLTDHNCQTYYYLGDGLTKEDCGLILSAVWYRQDCIEITHSDGGD